MASDPTILISKKLLLSFLLISMVVAPPPAMAGITCDTVYNDLQPCLSYVLVGGSVPEECCSGLKSLLANATTTPDRQSACSCVKNLASAATGEEVSRAASITGQCGANVPFKISPDVDCSKVN
uniref:Non-specific lipid-transfer protein n=2 Tax=Nicotiana TaxID=4085 RepID=A0A1S4CYG5_TOBAC|nr:PREDICTED: non-specific lipid-transfer protein 1-like [Nicotiana sylvestris]XP_016506044.1 PREDICTED: non-specific lipid-transfer protein 1-like [Nicotiana tabacum]